MNRNTQARFFAIEAHVEPVRVFFSDPEDPVPPLPPNKWILPVASQISCLRLLLAKIPTLIPLLQGSTDGEWSTQGLPGSL
jgi:hypothetical protein